MFWLWNKLKILGFVAALMLGIGLPVVAQEPTPATENGILIHVVQRGETLSQIAQQYGITLESIIALNTLIDPNSIQAGQRITIPSGRLPTQGVVLQHTVQPGETLFTIAQQYNSTPQSLAQVNQIFNAASLYVGQNLVVTAGANGRLPPEQASMHAVAPDDTLWRIAMRYGVDVFTLAETNQITVDDPLQNGQTLVIPDSQQASRFVEFPNPIRDFQLGPLPIEQGRSIAAYLETEVDATVSGRVLDRDITFTTGQTIHTALIGIHSFTNPGIYPLTLSITDSAGQMSTYTVRMRVVGGGYGSEEINIPPERQDLLAPELVQAELERVTGIMTGYTGDKYFSGLMSLPSIGPVTSQYGTRRSYNGSPYDTFHGGADFGGAPGTLVTAPADGIVVLAEPLNVRGNTVIIDHGRGVYTGYWHNTDIFVTAGQFVERGTAISTIGSTGLVTGAHLHWEMWVGGVQVDPLQWLAFNFDSVGATASDPETASATP